MSRIFLSHNHGDKPFVRKLGADLSDNGIGVWIDEAEMFVGDSLIEKIESAIDDMEYLGVILSPNSVTSEWVNREVRQALTQEIASKKVKVLPILLKDCELPGFLKDKIYADFRDASNYTNAFGDLVRSLKREKGESRGDTQETRSARPANESYQYRKSSARNGATDLSLHSVTSFPVEYSSAVAFSADFAILASAHFDTITAWNLSSEQLILTLSRPMGNISSIAFSPDSTLLASGSDALGSLWLFGRSTVTLWDIRSGNEINSFAGASHEVNSVAFSPDARMLVAGKADSTVRVWDIASGKQMFKLSSSNSLSLLDCVYSVTFSPDGKLLASGNYDKTVKIWHMYDTQDVTTFDGGGRVKSVAFSPDGTLLATQTDLFIRLWDLSKGQVLQTLRDDAGITCCAFSEDGRLLVSGSKDHIKLWELKGGRTLHVARIPESPTPVLERTCVKSVALPADGSVIATWESHERLNVAVWIKGR